MSPVARLGRSPFPPRARQAGAPARQLARASLPLVRSRAVAGVLVALLASTAATRRRRTSHAAADRSHRSSAATSGLSNGDVLRGARRPARREHRVDRSRRAGGERLLASPWVRDAALRRSLPSTIEVVVPERQPIGIGRMSGDAVSGRRARRRHRRVRPAVRRPRSADHRRPVGDEPGRPDTTDEARAELAARADRGAAGRSRPWRAACRRWTSPTCTTRR